MAGRQDPARCCLQAAGVALTSTGAATCFDAVDFGADFLAAGFFFTAADAAFALGAFLAGATAFFAACFGVFFATLTAFAALAEPFFAAAGAFAAASGAALLPTRKASRFLALAIQPGARPNPDQVFPVFGSAYLATDAVFTFAFFEARLPATARANCSMVRLNSAMMSLADGVDAAIEVKPDLSSKVELERGLKQGVSVKRLRRMQSGLIHVGTNTVVEQWAFRIPYFIFSMKAKADPMGTGREVLDYYRSNAVERLDQADVIVVNNVGVLVNIQTPQLFPWGIQLPDPAKVGWFFCSWKDSTLVRLLMHLHLVPHARMKVQEVMLLHYLKRALFDGLQPIGAYPPYDTTKPV